MSDMTKGEAIFYVIFFIFAVLGLVMYDLSAGDEKAEKTLRDIGIKPTQIETWTFFDCGDDDTVTRGFTGIRDGKQVQGAVCCGVLKGCYVRYK